MRRRWPRSGAGWPRSAAGPCVTRRPCLTSSHGALFERVLDVGCGSGYLLRLLASRGPDAAELAGLDPAPGMIKVAAASA
ncbi:MAG TPA: class I SAM-dependent methyltransferase, partial [Streptosporangiaceae bacterium]|nr:class I SAM-dependent methyltransferase [Streptosporangiaceae bacterium]